MANISTDSVRGSFDTSIDDDNSAFEEEFDAEEINLLVNIDIAWVVFFDNFE